MASSCIYNYQEECDPRECDYILCTRSSYDKLKCDYCGQVIDKVYYVDHKECHTVCEECLENFYKIERRIVND